MEAVTLYTFLRFDAESGRDSRTQEYWKASGTLASFADLQSIGALFATTQTKIWGLLGELQRLGWITSGNWSGISYNCLTAKKGETSYYLVDIAERSQGENRLAAAIRKQANTFRPAVVSPTKPAPPKAPKPASNRMGVHEDLSDDLLSAMQPSAVNAYINRHYTAKYEQTFNEKPGFMTVAKERSHGTTIFKVCGESVEKARSYIDFILENWAIFKKTFNIRGLPTPSFMCQAWVYGLVHEARTEGFKKRSGGRNGDGIGNRADDVKDNQTHGW